MRISDWSSDVCSSDLHIGADDLREDARLGRAQIGLAGLDTEFRRPDGIAHRAALIDGNRKLAAGADQPRRRDRKSVASGKGVSVRLHLGGRRIITNKIDQLLIKSSTLYNQ